jgi:hypothetical protein
MVDAVAVDDKLAILGLNSTGEEAVGGIVLEHVHLKTKQKQVTCFPFAISHMVRRQRSVTTDIPCIPSP